MRLIDKNVLFAIVLIVILLTAFCVLYFQKDSSFIYKQGASSENDRAVWAALNLFQNEAKKMDLSNGPCLTNDLIPDWVVDIVHSPREEIDNYPWNQCQAYLEGRAKHFVELDLRGNVIRVK